MSSPTRRTSVTRQPVWFYVPERVPPVLRAAGLALGLIGHCKVVTWKELSDKIVSEDATVLDLLTAVDLSAEDSALLDEHREALRHVCLKPLVTIASCPDCGEWSLVSAQAPSRCKVTLRCAGKPVKASRATKVKVGEQPNFRAKKAAEPAAA